MPRSTAAVLAAVLATVVLAAADAPPARAQGLKIEPFLLGPQRPTGIISAHDGTGRLFLVSKEGVIRVFDGEGLTPEPFLDLRDQVNSNGSERGLHGLAFHPNFPETNYFYVTYTNLDSDSILSRWQVSENPDVADPGSEEPMLFVDQPQEWHNMSQLRFGPDGYLYIGSGDGGFVGDPDNRAQNLSELLGKLLRIDVDAAFPYAIPPDNPFVDTPGARPEIWAYGVRNPWRFSFDRATGDLFIGDVGQNEWEEVSHQPAASVGGENYGWRLMEGFHCYNPPSDCFDPSLTLPILEYQHEFFGGACAVIGGFVYRGERFPLLQGAYLYADFCSGEIWAARQEDGAWGNVMTLDSGITPTTFGEDEGGELYIADDDDGMIYRLLDARPFCDLATSQGAYTDGETVTASKARLVNLGDAGVTARFTVVVHPPSGPPVAIVDRGADGSLVVAPGTDLDRGPLDLFTVGPDTPRGAYQLVCRLTEVGGGRFTEDRAIFEIE